MSLLSAFPALNIGKDLLAGNIGENFGSVYQEGFALWDARQRLVSQEGLDTLEDILTFDATILNGDRQHGKTNLLRRGKKLLLIDHSFALPIHRFTEEQVKESPLFPERSVIDHCASAALANKGREFTRLWGTWKTKVDGPALNLLRSFIPVNWEKQNGDLDRIFQFLMERPKRFDIISADLRRIIQ